MSEICHIQYIHSVINNVKTAVYSDNTLSIKEKLNLINIVNQRLIDYSKQHFTTIAYEYYYQMRKFDDYLQSICDKVVNEIKTAYPSIEIIPTSSFTAHTNIDLSDLDFTVLIDDASENIENDLKHIGYEFDKIIKFGTPEMYTTYTKKIDEIEIELKLRSKTASQYIISLHKYNDNELQLTDKIHITYIKHLLKNFKSHCHCHVNDNSNDNGNEYLMYKYITYDSSLFKMNEFNHIIGRI